MYGGLSELDQKSHVIVSILCEPPGTFRVTFFFAQVIQRLRLHAHETRHLLFRIVWTKVKTNS